MDNNENQNWSHLAWTFGGLITGFWLARNQIEEAKKRRAIKASKSIKFSGGKCLKDSFQ